MNESVRRSGMLLRIWTSLGEFSNHRSRAPAGRWQKRALEAVTVIAFLVGFRAIFQGLAHFNQDPEYWYAIYHHFARGFYNGAIQLWNPFMNGGEPLWPAYGLFRLIDPINIAFLAIGWLIDIPPFDLYHAQFVLKIGVSFIGMHLLLKRVIDWHLACVLSSAFVAASFYSVYLSDAYYMVLCWIPFILYFTIRALQDGAVRDLGWAVYFVGVYIGAASYHVALGGFFLLCFLVTTLVWNWRQWAVLGRQMLKRKWPAVIAVAYLAVMSLPPAATIYTASRELHPIGRTAVQRDLFESAQTYTPSYSQLMDPALMNLGASMSFRQLLENIAWFPNPPYVEHRLLQAVSALAVLLAIFGICLGRNRWKWQFLIVTAIMGTLVLGPRTPVHEVFYTVFWPLRYVRQVFVFYVFVLAGLGFFVALGLDELRRRLERWARPVGVATLLITSGWLLYVGSGAAFLNSPEERKDYFADFDPRARAWSLPTPRVFALPRTAYYMLEPILYDTNAALQMIAAPPAGKAAADLPYWRAWDAVERFPNRHPPTLGLRTFFWTKTYYEIYRLGENNLELFNRLMGVGEDAFTFRTRAIPTDDVPEFVQSRSAAELVRALDDSVLISRATALKAASLERLLTAGEPTTAPSRFAYDVLSYTPDRVRIAASVDQRGVLVYRDGHSNDWTARVDGDPVPIHKADVGFKGIVLPAGQHVVEFTYRPFYRLVMYAYIALALLLPAAVIGHRIFRSVVSLNRSRHPT